EEVQTEYVTKTQEEVYTETVTEAPSTIYVTTTQEEVYTQTVTEAPSTMYVTTTQEEVQTEYVTKTQKEVYRDCHRGTVDYVCDDNAGRSPDGICHEDPGGGVY
ncbi:hypothetical protein M433DRAFT_10749, partial [Acidomyces richmondensis BFW]